MEKTKRQQILDTAAALFREKGYSATTMRDLAEAIGIKAASLYNHIKSKQEILQELLMHIANRFVTGMDEVENSSLSPFQKIEHLIALHVRITTEETNAISLITQDWRHLEEPALSEYLGHRTSYEDRFRNIIAEGIKKGELSDVHPEIALFSILSTMRWLYAWYSRNEKMSPVELQKQLTACLIEGIKK